MREQRTRSSKKMRSDAQHSFAQIPHTNVPRSKFDRSAGLTTAFGTGFLVPIFVDEALPGDTMTMHVSTFARLQPTVVPIMDNLYMDLFFFAVPNRLVWENWERFMGAQDNPDDHTNYLVPEMTSAASVGHLAGSLSDYLGIPAGVPDLTHSSLFHRAVHLIWNEWFRDENLQDSATVDIDDGPDDPADYPWTLQRGKRHDYFTSCLPFPQKGTAVQLPIGDTAPVVSVGGGGIPTFASTGGGTSGQLNSGAGNIVTFSPTTSSGQLNWSNPGLEADLSSATSSTINEIREAFQLQRLFERDARGGTRYTELLRSHFGVVSADQRLQRPEYLGGGSTRIAVHPVAQQSQTDTTVQANLSAFGTATYDGRGFHKSFTEHNLILGFACVRADLNYQQGLNRMFSRSTRFDYYWPSLAHLGEQEVFNKEIYAQGDANDDLVFGYQERYAEYRYKPSETTSWMRSSYAQSLDVWHLAQDFASLPLLNADFIVENPPIQRVLAVPSEPAILFDAFYQYTCVRPMPTYSVPGYVDHF